MSHPRDEPLERLIIRCGRAYLGFTALLAVLSYGLASFAPLGLRQVPETEMFLRGVAALPLSPGAATWLAGYLTGHSLLADPWIRGAAWALPTGGLTICFLLVLRRLLQAEEPGPGVSRLLVRYAAIGAGICVVTYPVFTTDFWLSVVWGRMIVAGQDPYYAAMTSHALQGLPIANWGDRMTYGPLWAALSALLALAAHRVVLLEFLLFKGLLAGAWILILVLLGRLAGLGGARERAVALCLFGWLPMSMRFAVAEGHNDVVMVALLVLWLLLLARGRYGCATLAIIASGLVKYVTLPLLALDLLAARLLGRVSWRRYLGTLLAAGVSAAALFLLFAHGPGFFEPMRKMRNWHFWTPATALVELGRIAGLSLSRRLMAGIVLTVCACLVAVSGLGLLRHRTFRQFLNLNTALVATSLFVVVGHVWPWFVLWTIPLAALTWRSPLAWFLLALGMLTPFLNLHWLVGTDWSLRPVSGMFYYLGAAAITLGLFLHSRSTRRTPGTGGAAAA